MTMEGLDFEASMKRLEEIVQHLERGDLPLEESLKLFEEGTKLSEDCASMLDAAEQRVVRLKKGPDREPVELEDSF